MFLVFNSQSYISTFVGIDVIARIIVTEKITKWLFTPLVSKAVSYNLINSFHYNNSAIPFDKSCVETRTFCQGHAITALPKSKQPLRR